MDESALRSIPLFESLPKGARKVVARHAEELDVGEGTELVRQGEFAYEFFVIEEGTADVLRDGERIDQIGPGDFLGEMGIVGMTIRNATVVTTSPARVIVLTERDFLAMKRGNEELAAKITAAVEERCRKLDGSA
jgi:CRP-like cAMP-binding protein